MIIEKEKIISIVTPVYNEEKNISIFYVELNKVINQLADKYFFEIIFINDGSRDASILELQKIAEENENVKVLNFSRNFGKEAALSAGLNFSNSEAVITMDSDLQHPAVLIKNLIQNWERGYEVVYTVRRENQGAGLIKKITSQIYWWLFNKISSTHSVPYSTDFRLLDRKVVEEFKKFSERERLYRGIVDWMGFKRFKIEFSAPMRKNGQANYSYFKLIQLAVNSLTAFSLLPLRIAGYLGIFITFSSLILLFIMLVSRWFYDPSIFSSLAFVVVLNTILIGLVLTCLGLIALYIARIHNEVSNRPLYIIKNKINFDDGEKK